MSESADCQGRGRERVLDPVVLAAGLGLVFVVALIVEVARIRSIPPSASRPWA